MTGPRRPCLAASRWSGSGSRRRVRAEQTVQMTAAATNTFVSRPFVFPVPGDTLQSVADRVLPDVEGNRDTLLAWNPHLVLRAPTMDAPGGMLPTDLVYTEPPS
jgi:hypothetical protein